MRCIGNLIQLTGVVSKKIYNPSARKLVLDEKDANEQPGFNEHDEELQDVDVEYVLVERLVTFLFG